MDRESVGVGFIDGLLDGGLEKDAITTIFGPAGAGKTNLALLASVSVALSGRKVVFVDTEGGFSVDRLKQVSGLHKKILSNMVFFRPNNFAEQCRSIEQVERMLKSKASKNFGLVVVDTIGMLYRLERRTGEAGDINLEFSRQLGVLNSICRSYNIPVLLTNQVFSRFGTDEVFMVGGDLINYTSKCIIELKVLGGKRKFVLHKHRSMAPGKELFFVINDKGFSQL